MVLNNYIKSASTTIIFFILVLFFSCEKPGIINCADCLESEPVTAKIEIMLDDYPSITVNIYECNLEDSIIYESVSSVVERTLYRTVPLNRKYTVTATYYDRGNYYVAVNSVTPHVLYDKDFCEEPCYYIYDNKVNLRLKYTRHGGK
jgi:hypothetical protein